MYIQRRRDPAAADATPADAAPGKRALTDGLGAGGAVPHQAQMETAFWRSFAHVDAHTGERGALGAMGATAAASGSTVSFAETAPSPWLVAHELTHVVQQEQAGAAGVARKAIAPSDSAAEREADAVADRVVRGEPAGEIREAPAGAIHRFTPSAHETSTVDGLAATYAAEEIGAIYQSNWERDFSQGHSSIASAAIAWTALKNHVARHGASPAIDQQDEFDRRAATFRAAAWAVVDGDLMDAAAGCLGKSQTWEHMDQPDKPFERAVANDRWWGKTNGLAGYLLDSKAYIKDHMVAAIDVYREVRDLGAVGGAIDNWDGAHKKTGYVTPTVTRDGDSVSSTFPANFEDDAVASRAPLREATALQATAAGARSDPNHNADLWRIVGQHLGRAMHAFQDFWAHSNWLELAKEAATTSVEIGNERLKTGTFGSLTGAPSPSEAHALGHKLLGLATAFQGDFGLLLRAYNRSAPSRRIDEDAAVNGARSTQWGGGGSDHDMAYDALRTDSWSTAGEVLDVGVAANNVEELILSGNYAMDDFLCNQDWLEALAQKGRTLIEQGDANADRNSHGFIAKDQHEAGDGHKDHGGALAIATAADAMAFGPLRAIMDLRDPAEALAATQRQLAIVDTLLQAPSPAHPLWHLVARMVTEGDAHDHAHDH